jgi:hypothetical protein
MTDCNDLSLNLLSLYNMKARHRGNVMFLTQYLVYMEGMM